MAQWLCSLTPYLYLSWQARFILALAGFKQKPLCHRCQNSTLELINLENQNGLLFQSRLIEPIAIAIGRCSDRQVYCCRFSVICIILECAPSYFEARCGVVNMHHLDEEVIRAALKDALVGEVGVQHAEAALSQRHGDLSAQGPFKKRARADFSTRCCVVAWRRSSGGLGPRIEQHDDALGLAAAVLRRLVAVDHTTQQQLRSVLGFGLVRPDGAIDLTTKAYRSRLGAQG